MSRDGAVSVWTESIGSAPRDNAVRVIVMVDVRVRASATVSPKGQGYGGYDPMSFRSFLASAGHA